MQSARGMLDLVSRRARFTRRAWLLTLLCAVSVAAACRGNKEDEEVAEPAPATWLVVRNQAFLDMNIFVYRSTQRIRLGMVNGSSTARILIPANYLYGTTPLRFQADPIGGSRKPVTQEINVAPGDEIELTIPPV